MAAPTFSRAHHQQALHHTKGRNLAKADNSVLRPGETSSENRPVVNFYENTPAEAHRADSALRTNTPAPIIGAHPRIVQIDETTPPTQIPPGQTWQRCRFVHNRYAARRRRGPLAEQRRPPPRLPAPLRIPPCGLRIADNRGPTNNGSTPSNRSRGFRCASPPSYSNGHSSLSRKSRTHPLNGSVNSRPVHLSSIGTAKSSSSAGNNVG